MKALQALVILVLIAICGASGVAIAFPSESKTFLRDTFAAKPKSAGPTLAAVAPSAGAAGTTIVRAAQTPAAGQPVATPRRPLTRQEIEAQRRQQGAGTATMTSSGRKATFQGDIDEPMPAQIEIPKLYPFEVTRRTFPTGELLRVEMNIKNLSGIFWSTAFIDMKSDAHPQLVRFKVDDWRLDEVITLEYTMPKAEVEKRLKGLRLIRVSGVRRESALSEMISEMRVGRKTTQPASGSQSGSAAARPADDIRVPGLLGMISSARAASLNANVEVVSARSAAEQSVAITIPADLALAKDLRPSLMPDTPARKALLEPLTAAYAAALAAQENLYGIADLLSKMSYAEAKKSGRLVELRENVKLHLDRFNEAGTKVATQAASSRDGRMEEAAASLGNIGDRLMRIVGSVEDQVRKTDPEFAL